MYHQVNIAGSCTKLAGSNTTASLNELLQAARVYICEVLILVCLLPTTSWAQSSLRVDVGLFSHKDTSGWEVRDFAGATDYSLIRVDGKQVLVADSQQSASAFYKKINVNLDKTPILNWSWRKEQSINPGNELDKKGDDYVARIYVVKSGGLLLWETIALNLCVELST